MTRIPPCKTAPRKAEELADLYHDQRVFAGAPHAVTQYLVEGVDSTVPTPAIDQLEVEEGCQLDAACEASDINNIVRLILRDAPIALRRYRRYKY